jgi:hypothetical protein
MKNFHCCATCEHFQIKKEEGVSYFCKRLGYATKPEYRFKCWSPKDNVRRLMQKQEDESTPLIDDV